MNTDTGRFYIDENTEKLLQEQQAGFLESLKSKPIVLRNEEKMPDSAIPVDRLPDPNCHKCGGTGHKPRHLATQKYRPCSCVL